MSARLGAALAAYIAKHGPAKGSKFVVIEGVAEALADAISKGWTDDLPPLAIASASPQRFGRFALKRMSGTGLRNKYRKGICVVICEGQQLRDRQSIKSFENVAPTDLLVEPDAFAHLADPKRPGIRAVAMDGPVRQVRQAILTAGAAERPGAQAVAEYLDAVAMGEAPLATLPILGAFADETPPTRVSAQSILENLRLASRRKSQELLRPISLADIRLRSMRVFSRRLAQAQAQKATEDFMSLLQSGSEQVLRAVRFDEAREVLGEESVDLSEQVRREISDFRRNLSASDPTQAEGIPWERMLRDAGDLRRADGRRDAALHLTEFDTNQARAVFQPPTRKKLDGLLRDRVVQAGGHSCPEAAIAKAILSLGARPTRIKLLHPAMPDNVERPAGARQALAIAAARLRLGGLLRLLHEDYGTDIDGVLLRNASELLSQRSFEEAEIGRSQLPLVQMRVYAGESSVQVDWSPDLDDIAALRAALLFAGSRSLVLPSREAGLRTFCSGPIVAELPPPEPLRQLAGRLQRTAKNVLERGFTPGLLRGWVGAWEEAVKQQPAGDLEDLGLAGAVRAADRGLALTAFAPLKAEWLASYLEALWEVNRLACSDEGGDGAAQLEQTAAGIARATAAHYPAFIRTRMHDQPLLPTHESRIWSVFGVRPPSEGGRHAEEALRKVLERLLKLQPEAAGHLRCLAWGAGAADLMLRQAMALVGRQFGKATFSKCEIFCVGDRPSWETLAAADDELGGDREAPVKIRYFPDFTTANQRLANASGVPAVHLALITGITAGGARLRLDTVEMDLPPRSDEVLFAPRTWLKPRAERRVLLIPPGVTPAKAQWLRLMTALDDAWPEEDGQVRIPELRLGTVEVADELRMAHDLALWVATLDRYATRESLEVALGPTIAILHQERRLSGDSPLALVISQKSGSSTDRAIGRSLRTAKIVADADVALSIGTELRRVASQGYGILALEAATTGAGINELVGHVVAFSLLSTRTTPWPLPPSCRILLVSLDEYDHWFPSGRYADLLAIAIDTRERGLHVAAIEIKARRSDARKAVAEAIDQLRQTLTVTRWAAYPQAQSIHSRLWLNRIAEAAYAVGRESRLRLSADELAAIENFRRGDGTLEWAGLGLVFGPQLESQERHFQHTVSADRVPIVVQTVKLTEEILRAATGVKLAELRTVETSRTPLEGGRTRRRPEAGVPRPTRTADGGAPQTTPTEGKEGAREEWAAPAAGTSAPAPVATPEQPATAPAPGQPGFVPPILGWDISSDEQIRWSAAGANPELPNGHIEIWGSSGMGKTQFTMSLLAQLAHTSGSHFGIADFKNDYGGAFPERMRGEFLDLWDAGAPYNPLALDERTQRNVERAIIELRDTVDVATRSFTKMGHRQLDKLRNALVDAYARGQADNRWPTLKTLDDSLGEDLAGVIGDLTRNEIFRDGPPLGEVVNRNVVFGLSNIPGNGLTTILAAGFILSALLLKLQGMPPVANTIRYAIVVDEAHRVAQFRAIDTMVREGRSKGLAVILATQQPGDLPEVVGTNAQTKICFRLPDATVAAAAARRLDPGDSELATQIRTLGVGEAFVGLGGARPRLLRMAQFWRHAEALGLPTEGS